MKTPTTSTTLLKCLGDAQSSRWGDFVERYEPSMRAFLAARFPSVPADDLIQETLVTLVRAMPSYVYSPREKGFFHNYLFGILRHKALHHLRDADREKAAREAFAAMADPSIREQSKQIFVRVAINGEKPEDVAAAFGVTRNSVDQTKARLVAKLRIIKEELVISG